MWRRPDERFIDATVHKHNRYGDGSVMLGGGMSLGIRTPLHLVDGILNGIRYRDEVLEPILLPVLGNLGPQAQPIFPG